MPHLANTAQIREADRIMIEDFGYPGILLMETAGRKSAELLMELYPQQETFWVLAGPGNNGGDGLVIARYLHLAGKAVKVSYSHNPDLYKGDAEINEHIIRHLSIPRAVFSPEQGTQWLAEFNQPPVLIDALLGTGVRSGLREPIHSILAFFNSSQLPVIAIDLPSGLSADTGVLVNDPLQAVHTFTFQLPKLCHYLTPASLKCGKVHVIDIDIWPSAIEKLSIKRYALDARFVQERLKLPAIDAHKGTQGHVLLIGGSRDMTGAIAMTAQAAIRSGAGLCTVLAPAACRNVILHMVPEAMCPYPGSDNPRLGVEATQEITSHLSGKTAVVIGPGMGQHPETLEFLKEILPRIKAPLLVDADGINLLAENPDLWELLPQPTLLTPHPGEMKRLTPKAIHTDRLKTAEDFAQQRGKTIVLKGAGTIIACPDTYTYVNTTGNPGMATGGSGDILSGILGALLAQGYSPATAATIAVFIHGKAGDLAACHHEATSMRATDITQFIGPALRELRI